MSGARRVIYVLCVTSDCRIVRMEDSWRIETGPGRSTRRLDT